MRRWDASREWWYLGFRSIRRVGQEAKSQGAKTSALPIPEWLSDRRRWLWAEQDEDVAAIRKHTRTGRPLGDQRFVKKLERLGGRSLLAAPAKPTGGARWAAGSFPSAPAPVR